MTPTATQRPKSRQVPGIKSAKFAQRIPGTTDSKVTTRDPLSIKSEKVHRLYPPIPVHIPYLLSFVS